MIPTRQTIHPADKTAWLNMRVRDVTSTEISALFGISPYSTAYELWHAKRSKQITAIEPNERMTWGTRLEEPIAKGVCEDNGWDAQPFKEYMRAPDLRIGASFDWRILPGQTTGIPSKIDLRHVRGPGLLEIKNVDGLVFRNEWLKGDDNAEAEAPPHIELQIQHQMLVSGLSWGVIAALVGGNNLHMILRMADPAIAAAITTRVAEFWESVDAGAEPTPDFSRDASAIMSIYNHAQPGKIHDATGQDHVAGLLNEYTAASEESKRADARKQAAKAEIITIMGDAEKLLAQGYSVSAGLVGESEIAYTRKPYRTFRVYQKKT